MPDWNIVKETVKNTISKQNNQVENQTRKKEAWAGRLIEHWASRKNRVRRERKQNTETATEGWTMKPTKRSEGEHEKINEQARTISLYPSRETYKHVRPVYNITSVLPVWSNPQLASYIRLSGYPTFSHFLFIDKKQSGASNNMVEITFSLRIPSFYALAI